MANAYADRVIERAQRDDAFRKLLLDDPRAAISEDLGDRSRRASSSG